LRKKSKPQNNPEKGSFRILHKKMERKKRKNTNCMAWLFHPCQTRKPCVQGCDPNNNLTLPGRFAYPPSSSTSFCTSTWIE
jgi:hypothetical protein